MKLCTFEVRTQVGRVRRLGAVTSLGIIDLNFAAAARYSAHDDPRPQKAADFFVPSEMREFLTAGLRARAAASETVEWLQANPRSLGPNEEVLLYPAGATGVALCTPLPNPSSLRDFFAFEQHVKTAFGKRQEPVPREWYEIPVYYKSGHHNIIGTDADVHWPSFTRRFDYELELAVIIGKKGTNIPAERAGQYIAGFTIMNDFSARDIQRKEMQVLLGPAKGKDWCTAIGPWLVTPDEIGDPYNLRMTARVNGELWSDANSNTIHWTFAQMIEFLTKDDTIYPGDILGSGTVGTGCGLELDRWVQRGDVIELEIEKIGVLRNRVV
jgi:2-keto-4-pentenoate hydratase/2-oxohepta-3-ene-1,7-dioic acid hydratase in catechol pathway